MYFNQNQYVFDPSYNQNFNNYYNPNNMYNNFDYNYQIQQQYQPPNNVVVETPKQDLFSWSRYKLNENIKSVENAVINFLIEYFGYDLDSNNFLSIYDEDNYTYNRISYNKKFFNLSKDVCAKSKKYIWFNPIFDFATCRFIFDRFLEKNNIDILTMYILDNKLYIKDYDGNVIYNSRQFNHNQNLCYLDIIFRLSNRYIDLSIWDIEIDNI